MGKSVGKCNGFFLLFSSSFLMIWLLSLLRLKDLASRVVFSGDSKEILATGVGASLKSAGYNSS